jgi:hypothetical protein
VAIGGGLAYSLLLEGLFIQLLALVGGKLADVGLYLPAGLARSLLESNAGLTVEVGGATAPLATGLAPEVAAIGIALYTLLFMGLAMLAFQRQDLGG